MGGRGGERLAAQHFLMRLNTRRSSGQFSFLLGGKLELNEIHRTFIGDCFFFPLSQI